MNVTKNITTVTCPHCNHTTTTDVSLDGLAAGQKLVCEKCGKEIVIDRSALASAEKMLENLPIQDILNKATVSETSLSLSCPHCNTMSSYKLSLEELADGRKVFCSNCGKEIAVDREKLQKAEDILKGLKIPTGDGKTETLDADGNRVVIQTTTKTYNLSSKDITDPGDVAEVVSGEIPPGTGAPTTPRAIGPKGGCFGVLAMLSFLTATVLILSLFIINHIYA